MDSLGDRLRALYEQGLYSLEELRAMITGEPYEQWESTPDGRYVDVAAALREGKSLSYDQHGNFIGAVAPAAEDLEAGDLVALNEDGSVSRSRGHPIGVAIDEATVALFGSARVGVDPADDRFLSASFCFASGSYQGSQAYIGDMDYNLSPHAQCPHDRMAATRSNYQYSKFDKEAIEKAWKLLEKYMTPDQYFAFMEGTTVELINKAETHRLLLNKKGDFTILQGIKAGSGITESYGRIHSYDYPLGDEISAFLDWFRHRTGELIANWNCGTYGIVKEGERR